MHASILVDSATPQLLSNMGNEGSQHLNQSRNSLINKTRIQLLLSLFISIESVNQLHQSGNSSIEVKASFNIAGNLLNAAVENAA